MEILDCSTESRRFKDVPVGMVFRDNFTYIKIDEDIAHNAVRLDTGHLVSFEYDGEVEVFPNATLVLQGV